MVSLYDQRETRKDLLDATLAEMVGEAVEVSHGVEQVKMWYAMVPGKKERQLSLGVKEVGFRVLWIARKGLKFLGRTLTKGEGKIER